MHNKKHIVKYDFVDKKICLIISGLMYGGGQRVVLDILQQCKKRGSPEVRLVLLGCRFPELESLAHYIVSYDGRYNTISTLICTAFRLRIYLNSNPIQIIHSHGWDADIISWLAIQGSLIKQIVHLHVVPEWLNSRKIKHLLRRWLTRIAFLNKNNTLVAVSDSVRCYWAEHLYCSQHLIQVIKNGIDIESYKPSPVKKLKCSTLPTIAVVARLAPMKGIDYLIYALGALATEGIKFRFEIAGIGRNREILEKQVAEAGIEECTTFCGMVQDMQSYYRKIDIFVLPSLSEGLPLTVLEAMASGVPVVVTAVGGIPEVIRDGVDGLLVPPRDSASLLAKLRILLEYPNYRGHIGQAGRLRVVKQYSLDRFSNELLGLYSSIQSTTHS